MPICAQPDTARHANKSPHLTTPQLLLLNNAFKLHLNFMNLHFNIAVTLFFVHQK